MFTFELTRLPAPKLSGFDLGHVRIDVDGRHATSEGRTPDQAFMVFVTAADLLDQVAAVVGEKRQRSSGLICTDSSMRIDFRIGKKEQIEIALAGQWLGTVAPDVLATTVFTSVMHLLEENPLEASEAARQDLDMAIREFAPNLKDR